MRSAGECSECDVIVSPVIWEKTVDGRLADVETRLPRPHDPWALLALWRLPQTGGPLWKRSALERVGGWQLGQPCCQEHELYFRLLEADCRFAFCDGSFAVYRDWDHGSRLSLRHSGEVDRERLLILDRMERRLRARAELTPARHHAVNDARHQIARKQWVRNPTFALHIARQIQDSDGVFRPSEGPASPLLYRLAYRLLGFERTQHVAACRRSLSSMFGFIS